MCMKSLAVADRESSSIFPNADSGFFRIYPGRDQRYTQTIMPTATRRKQEQPKIINHNPDVLDPEEIARLAHSYWESRDGIGGSPEDDWYRAVEELHEREAVVASD